MKQLLASVDRLPPERARSIRAALEPEQQRAIEEASTVEWLPIAPNLALARSLHAVLGPSECHRFHRAHFAEVLRGPVLGTLLQGALAVYGFDPARWMRLLPHAWDLLFRDCGTWSIDPSTGARLQMTLSALPPECVADRSWPTTVASSIGATLDLARKVGSVDIVQLDPRERQVRFQMRWS